MHKHRNARLWGLDARKSRRATKTVLHGSNYLQTPLISLISKLQTVFLIVDITYIAQSDLHAFLSDSWRACSALCVHLRAPTPTKFH
jgi:hypothetical protein